MLDAKARFLLSRSRAILRYEGLQGLWYRLLGRLGYQREGWFERCLREPITPPRSGLDVEVTELREEDAEVYLDFRRGAKLEDFEQRMRQGCRCYCARYEGRLVAATWTLEGGGYVERLRRELRLRSDAVYLFDSYTLPQLRGRRLQDHLSVAILEDCRRRGFLTAVALIEPHNLSSVRSFERSGYRRTGTLARMRIGPWCRELSFGRTEEGPRPSV